MPIGKPSALDKLKMVYQEIIEGCSYSPKGFFIKHLCEIEQIELVRKRIEFVDFYIQQGIPLEEERLAIIRNNGEWTDQQEGDISAYKLTITDNENLIPSLMEAQRPGIRKVIENHKKTLINLLIERKQLIGTTAEELAEKDGTYFLAYLTLFKDRSCNQPIFKKWEDFESLEEPEIDKYMNAIDESIGHINDGSIRRIASLPFFLNAFSYSREAIYTFLNKPIYLLTNYQVHLFSLGSRNLSTISQSEGSPPECSDDSSIEEIVKWYDTQYSVMLGKRHQANNS